jgi:hypothetical protein
MKASDILKSWRNTEPVFRQYITWIAFLRIAEAGKQGILRSELAHGHHCSPTRRCLLKAQDAGIITISYGKGPTSPITRYTITPKGLDWLCVKPETSKQL